MDLVILLPSPPRLTPSEGVTRVRSGVSIVPTPYEGQTALPWWWCLWLLCLWCRVLSVLFLLWNYTGFRCFSPPQQDLAVRLLKELTLCDGLTQIGSCSFKGCISLEKNEIKNKLESICSSVFEGCIGATELIIPKGNLKSIGNGALTGCVKINRVEIPDNVENLGTMVFMKCTGLREVILPKYISKRQVKDCSFSALSWKK